MNRRTLQIASKIDDLTGNNLTDFGFYYIVDYFQSAIDQHQDLDEATIDFVDAWKLMDGDEFDPDTIREIVHRILES